jgi:iron-sulfur cluster repair di-iron protein
MTSNPQNPSTSAPASEATRAKVLSALDELLEAERAGARVAMETGREISSPDLASLVEDIHKDEVRWCSMLMRTIRSLGATPSSATGAFWGKAMAIPDVEERLKFLNRGQSWVVRKLEALLPQIELPSAREDLNAMLQAHRQNIALVESRLTSKPAIESPPVTDELPPSDPSALIAYILRRFHEVHRRQLPELIQLAEKVETVHAGHPEVPRGLTVLLEQMHSELLDHMSKEEGVLFPLLARGGSSFATQPISAMMSEHQEHARRLDELMVLTQQATPPGDACGTWNRLCAATRQFSDDLRQHIRLENEVLFPQFDASLTQTETSDVRE